MSVAILYTAVGRQFGRRLAQTLEMERLLNDDSDLYRRFVVADAEALAELDSKGIEEAAHAPDFSGPETFNISRCRNIGLDWACQQESIDCVIIGDSDVLLLEYLWDPPPAGSYGWVTLLYSAPLEFIRGLPVPRLDPHDDRWGWSGCYVLPRPQFEQHRFCEEFVGYGFEDRDFRMELDYDDVALALVEPPFRGIHLAHPPRSWWRNTDEGSVNRDRFRRRIAERMLRTGKGVHELVGDPASVEGMLKLLETR
jgi:hypothetical protein